MSARRRQVNPSRSSDANTGDRSSSISAWVTHRRRPELEVPTGEQQQTALSPSLEANPLLDGGTPPDRQPDHNLLAKETKPALTRSQSTCPENGGTPTTDCGGCGVEEVQVDGSCLGNRVVWRGVLLRRTAVTLFEPSDGSGVEGAGGVPQTVLFGSNLMREPGGLATTEASFCLGVGTMEAGPGYLTARAVYCSCS